MIYYFKAFNELNLADQESSTFYIENFVADVPERLSIAYFVVSEPSTFGPWSPWKCEQACFNPNKLDLTSEFRQRTCTDGNPRHPTVNCDTLLTRDTPGRQCNERAAVPMCEYLHIAVIVVVVPFLLCILCT